MPPGRGDSGTAWHLLSCGGSSPHSSLTLGTPVATCASRGTATGRRRRARATRGRSRRMDTSLETVARPHPFRPGAGLRYARRLHLARRVARLRVLPRRVQGQAAAVRAPPLARLSPRDDRRVQPRVRARAAAGQHRGWGGRALQPHLSVYAERAAGGVIEKSFLSSVCGPERKKVKETRSDGVLLLLCFSASPANVPREFFSLLRAQKEEFYKQTPSHDTGYGTGTAKATA